MNLCCPSPPASCRLLSSRAPDRANGLCPPSTPAPGCSPPPAQFNTKTAPEPAQGGRTKTRALKVRSGNTTCQLLESGDPYTAHPRLREPTHSSCTMYTKKWKTRYHRSLHNSSSSFVCISIIIHHMNFNYAARLRNPRQARQRTKKQGLIEAVGKL